MVWNETGCPEPAAENKTSSTKADVYLYDEIGVFGTTADDLMRELKEIKTGRIVVHISSMAATFSTGSPSITEVDSLAASIASVIVQAGDVHLMVTGSQVMIHEAWGIGLGAAEHMREYADLLDRQTDTIAGIYAERAGGDQDHLLSLMKDETWMNPAEAVAEGLADAVVGPEPKNKVDVAAFIASCEVGGTASQSPNPFDKTRFLESCEIR